MPKGFLITAKTRKIKKIEFRDIGDIRFLLGCEVLSYSRIGVSDGIYSDYNGAEKRSSLPIFIRGIGYIHGDSIIVSHNFASNDEDVQSPLDWVEKLIKLERG